MSKAAARKTQRQRCDWCEHEDPIYPEYHDREWGVPVYDDQLHFEFLTLESAQAGLSWLTVLRKREGYRKAFADFDALNLGQCEYLIHETCRHTRRQKRQGAGRRVPAIQRRRVASP